MMWSRTLVVGVVAGMLFCGLALKDVSAGQYIADEHALCLLHFDEGSGTVAEDSSGNDNYGDLIATAAWAPGYFDGGVKGAEVLIRGNSTLNRPLYGLTAEAWIKFTGNTADWQNFLMGPQYSYLLSTVGGKIHCWVVNGPPPMWLDIYSTTLLSSLSGWHHVALTYDSTTGTAKIYIDGVEDARAYGPVGIPVGVGGDPNHVVGRGCSDAIDEVRISKVARTEADFAEMFESQVATALLEAIEAKLDAAVAPPTVAQIDDAISDEAILAAIDDGIRTNANDLVDDHIAIRSDLNALAQQVAGLELKVDALEAKLDIIDGLLRTPPGRREGWNGK